tara:strand:- start:3462 stop:4418 length:957 start_codon:yes stop_codon:yes gene_type:complete
MSITVVGSVAYDTVTTLFGKSERQLGGSAIYFSLAASKFTNVIPVGVYGEDFLDEDVEILKNNFVDTSNLLKEKGLTFFWEGKYDNDDMNNRETITTELNVFENFNPKLTDLAKNSDIVFLANINPELQLSVLDITKTYNEKSFVGLDTMDLWINNSIGILKKVIKTSDVVMIDQSEARMITAENNLKDAGYKIMELSSKNVVIKKGEHGVLVFTPSNQFALPGFLTNNVKDPTGAGDSFAGAFFGFLDSVKSYDAKNIFLASVFGTIVASYTVENFGVKSLLGLNIDLIYQRYKDYLKLIGYEYILNERQFEDYLNL